MISGWRVREVAVKDLLQVVELIDPNVLIADALLLRADLEPGCGIELELHGRKVPAEISRAPFYKRAAEPKEKK